ncbi:hypothetical protein AWB77_03248 [Caballeronia fortuita]|uniref:Uncharacterized protein n=1 Tax=Caballeronia fortuita TaxID=1777138 RepID=A0A158BTB8_9BURK|nr:hypothetical protein AWB77_03248 [Caballeronia fortuita]
MSSNLGPMTGNASIPAIGPFYFSLQPSDVTQGNS